MCTVVGQSGLRQASGSEMFFVQTLREAVAGLVLLGWALWSGQRMPFRRGWWSLLLLAGVTFSGELLVRPYVIALLDQHAAKSAQQQIIWMAGALWLALLGALRWVPEETPRATVGAALAGIAGFCLLLSANQLSVRWVEMPVLVLSLVQAVAMVWTWSGARRIFARGSVTMVAACGLLVSAAIHGLATLATPQSAAELQDLVWAEVWRPLALAVVTTGAAGVLWFWLLQHLELAAFSIHPVALWTVGLLWQAALFGFFTWRSGAALALGLGAIVVALRARLEDDDPVRLGLV